MKKIVFAHDMWFERHPDGRILSARGRWPWEHYLSFADSIAVTSRMRDLAAGTADDGLEDVRMPGVDFIEVPSLSGPLKTIAHRRRATAIVKAQLAEADGLVARLPAEIAQLAVHVARELGRPYAVEVVSCTWDSLWYRGGIQGKLYAPISLVNTRRTVRRAPFALYVTREFLQRRYPTRGYAAACSDVELQPLEDDTLERRLRSAASERSPYVIGTIATLTVRFKGIQTALEALGSIRNELPPFEYQIIGTGDPGPWRREAARHGIEDRVVFRGVLPHEEIFDWLDRVDLYAQPSFQEGLPRGLTEAMSRACPAVGSTAGGIPELLAPECTHTPGDAKTLAKLILRAATERGWATAHARRNFETAARYDTNVLDEVRRGFWDAFAARASRA